ncbi:MAG: ornithine cyclodeaminase family protein [Cyanobacteria bacterium J06632_22]
MPDSRPQTRLLSADDVQLIAQRVGLDRLMDEMIGRLTQAFLEFDNHNTVVPIRSGFNYRTPHVGLVEWMPLLQKTQQIVVKTVGYHPQNPELYGLPTVLSTISAYDPTSGRLLAVVDGTFLTALRTGAASAIASQYLAQPNSRTLGLVGAGAQAITQLHALSRRFDLKHVLVYDTDPVVMASFAERAAVLKLDLRIESAPLVQVTTAADILCTATSVDVEAGPVIPAQGLKPGLHINAVGADFPGKTEIPLSVLEQSLVCPDFYEQALLEGECQQFEDRSQIGPELFELVKSPAAYKAHQQQMTVFDSTGFALEDQTAMNLMLAYADELGLGTWMALESVAADVKNPYSFVPGTVGSNSVVTGA